MVVQNAASSTSSLSLPPQECELAQQHSEGEKFFVAIQPTGYHVVEEMQKASQKLVVNRLAPLPIIMMVIFKREKSIDNTLRVE